MGKTKPKNKYLPLATVIFFYFFLVGFSPIKLIVLDLDGTLLYKNKISEINIKAKFLENFSITDSYIEFVLRRIKTCPKIIFCISAKIKGGIIIITG